MVRPTQRSAQDLALTAVLDLPITEQYEVLEKLAHTLGSFAAPEKNVTMTTADRAARRAVAVTCLRRVSDQLRAEYDEAVTAAEAAVARGDADPPEAPARPGKLTRAAYDRLTPILDVPLTARQIMHVFGHWSTATDVLAGHLTLQAASTRAQTHDAVRFGDTTASYRHNQLIEGVRAFIRESPDDLTVTAYRAWVTRQNPPRKRHAKPRRADVDGPRVHYAHSNTVIDRLRASWPYVIDLAQGVITEAEARHRTLVDAESEPFVQRAQIACILDLGFRTVEALMASPGFPPPAIEIDAFHGWDLDDILALRNGTPPPNASQPPGFRTNEIITVTQLAAALGVRRNVISQHIHRGNLIPDGRLGKGKWWWRTNLEAVAASLGREILHPPAP